MGTVKILQRELNWKYTTQSLVLKQQDNFCWKVSPAAEEEGNSLKFDQRCGLELVFEINMIPKKLGIYLNILA